MNYHVPDATERDAFAAIAAQSFQFPVAEAPAWFDRAGHDNVRVVVVNGEVAGGLLFIHMAQFFGGRPVPMVGIAAVAVAPHHRGTGLATALMCRSVQELAEMGVALSVLYPASVRLYRKSGFEPAGLLLASTLPLATLNLQRADPVPTDHLRIRPLLPADHPACEALSADLAKHRNGQLQRGPYLWSRVYYHKHFGQSYGFGVFDGDQLRGHAWYAQTGEQHSATIVLRDVAAIDAAAGLKLWRHFASYTTMFNDMSHNLPPDDPWLGLLPEWQSTTKARLAWMLRMVDLPAAIGARGWPQGLTQSLTLQVHSDPCALLDGSWRITVADGQGQCARADAAAAPQLTLHVRALATLYAGYRSAHQLQQIGMLTGDPVAMASADALFAGQTPMMSDMF